MNHLRCVTRSVEIYKLNTGLSASEVFDKFQKSGFIKSLKKRQHKFLVSELDDDALFRYIKSYIDEQQNTQQNEQKEV